MQNFQDDKNNFNLFSDLDCQSEKFFPFVDPAEKSFVTNDCFNPLRIGTPTCKDPELDVFIDEVEGLDLNIELTSAITNIPSYIPTVTKQLESSDFLEGNQYPFIAVTLGDIISGGAYQKDGFWNESEIIVRLETLMHRAYKNKKVILFLTGQDTLIEHIWNNRVESKFFEKIAAMGFYAVVGFNFSVIRGECPVAHALAQKKSLFSSKILETNGVRTIPHVYAINKYQVDRYDQFFKANPLIRFFAINCQLQKNRIRDIDNIVETTSEILKRNPHLHVILQGFPIKHLWKFKTLLPQIHLVEKGPLKNAENWKLEQLKVDPVRLSSKDNVPLPKEELARRNFDIRRIYFEILKSEMLENYKIPTEIIREITQNQLLDSDL